jgi:hypothetical protein
MRGTLAMRLVMLLRMYFSGSRTQAASCRLPFLKLRKTSLRMAISILRTARCVGLHTMISNSDAEWYFFRRQIRYAEDLYVVSQDSSLLIIEAYFNDAFDYQGYKHYQHQKIAPLFAFG